MVLGWVDWGVSDPNCALHAAMEGQSLLLEAGHGVTLGNWEETSLVMLMVSFMCLPPFSLEFLFVS